MEPRDVHVRMQQRRLRLTGFFSRHGVGGWGIWQATTFARIGDGHERCCAGHRRGGRGRRSDCFCVGERLACWARSLETANRVAQNELRSVCDWYRLDHARYDNEHDRERPRMASSEADLADRRRGRVLPRPLVGVSSAIPTSSISNTARGSRHGAPATTRASRPRARNSLFRPEPARPDIWIHCSRQDSPIRWPDRRPWRISSPEPGFRRA